MFEQLLRLFTTMCSDALLGSRGLPSEGCLWCSPWTYNHQTQALQQTDISVSIYVLCNLGICAILRLRCTFSESRNCMPISRLCTGFTQSRDCAAPLHNFVYSSPRTRGFWEVRQLGETPFPSVWVRAQRDPRPVECPRSRHHHLWNFSTLFC